MSAMKESVTARSDVTKAEDVLGEKWDRCLADATIKTATGFALGAVLSLALFKRRQWPLVFGVGAGAGVGYANCQNEVRDSFRESAKEK